MNNLIKKDNLAFIFTSIVISSIPLFYFMGITASLIVMLSFIYNMALLKNHLPYPSKKILLFITLLFVFLLTLNFNELFSRSAGVPLLIVMANLKIMEIHNLRDELLACFLSFFILLSLILFSTSIFAAIYMFAAAFFTIGVILYINSPEKNLKKCLIKSTYYSIPALLCGFVLFFFFPRIQGNLWHSKQSAQNISGFAQSISPGSVSKIVQNNAPAFSIKFEKKMPAQTKYFRAIVFDYFNGTSWLHNKNKEPYKLEKTDYKNLNKAHIMLEPTHSKFLISPDFPVESPDRKFFLTKNAVLYSNNYKISKKKNYEILFSNDALIFPNPEPKDLILPFNSNPKAFEFGKKLRNLPKHIRVKKVLEYFHDNHFIYTLEPPLYKRNYIDEFMFEEKKGFCEHYASAFAFVMRAALVPSRIVGGYLGGEENKIGNFFIIKQSDAHAWCEVYLDDKGWVRIDPTTEAYPQRLLETTENIFENQLKTGHFNFISKIFSPFTSTFNAVNFFWNQKVIGYDFRVQQQFFKKLGVKNLNIYTKALFFVGIILSIYIFILFLFFLKNLFLSQKEPELYLFNKFQKKMKKKGIVKKDSEGFYQYLKRIEDFKVDNIKDIKSFVYLFIESRYGNKNTKETIKQMKIMLKKI